MEKIKEFIKKNTFMSPNDTIYVNKNIREGILPTMLKELILTRIMIKNSAKNVNIILHFKKTFKFI